jgi:hypothetical protein
MKKRLTLTRESIAELTAADLTTVVGGAESHDALVTCPVVRCAEEMSLLICDVRAGNTG